MAGWSCKYFHVIFDSLILMGAILAQQRGEREQLPETAGKAFRPGGSGFSGSAGRGLSSPHVAHGGQEDTPPKRIRVEDGPEELATPAPVHGAGGVVLSRRTLANMCSSRSAASHTDLLSSADSSASVAGDMGV